MNKIEEILDNNIYAKSGDCDCGYIGCGHYVEPEVVGKEKALEELTKYVEKEKKEAVKDSMFDFFDFCADEYEYGKVSEYLQLYSRFINLQKERNR